VPRYRFSDFVLSPRRRVLLRAGREVALIPRYFDLLLFLIEHRHEAVHRREIFDRVWSDVIVSDSALSQAIRTIRRALGDDSREPRFIRTVSRHGYRFVIDVMVEDDDDGLSPPAGTSSASGVEAMPASPDPFEPLLARLCAAGPGGVDEEEQREAAELLHTIGIDQALARLGVRPGHAHARALLRDVRWGLPEAANVPVLGAPAPLSVARELLTLRFRHAARIMAVRWAGASIGGALAGIVAGAIGGLVLAAAPGSAAPIDVAPVLALIGAICGGVGGAGVGAGLCLAEAAARSWRSIALTMGGALGGGVVGLTAELLGRWTLAALVGVSVPVGGALEGLVIGGAAGAGYAVATLGAAGGLATPPGRRRLEAAGVAALSCGLAALALATAGRPLVGGTVHAIARAAHGSQVSLTPLGRLIGEPDFGPVSQAVIAAGEGAMFGFGLVVGLTRRPRRT
jgi:DNA-binding winged helix-turn-helix (wHTH) protein